MLTINIIKDQINIFHTVKIIPFADVIKSFVGQDPNRAGKILCPFHNERTASFQVYEDSGYCFGCTWRGDSIAFVAQLEGLEPLESARLIAARFGLPAGKPPTKEGQRQFIMLERKRNIVKAYRDIEEEAFLNMANFRSLVMQVLSAVGFDEMEPETEKAVNLLPLIENYMNTLATGTPEERLQLLREGVLIQWKRLT